MSVREVEIDDQVSLDYRIHGFVKKFRFLIEIARENASVGRRIDFF